MNENQNFIKKGTTVFATKPFAYCLSSKYRTSVCDYCFKSGKLLRCCGCQYVYYCNQTCQKRSWRIHGKECANLKRISPKIVPDFVRLMARIIIKLNQGGSEEIEYYDKTNFRRFKDLMSHYSDIKNDMKRAEHFLWVCHVLYEFLEDIPMPNCVELMGIYGRICINSFNIYNYEFTSIGVGIYLGASILDHSCKPNTVVVFEGTTIIVKTIEDLPCLDWSQASVIRISYIDVLQTTRDRRSELQSRYYFWCRCKKCEEAEPMAEAAACPNKFCTYPCSPDAVVCESCNTKFPEDFKKIFDEISDFTADNLDSMVDVAYLDVSKVCLAKQEGVLHSLNIQHLLTLRCAFESSISLKHWEEADIYSKELLNGYLTYYGKIHPVTGLLILTTADIKLNMNESKEAIELIKKASVILKITHGEQHSIIKEYL
ncbi:SET and MYND domain-containing protein 3, partial [Eufriesea mexicana]